MGKNYGKASESNDGHSPIRYVMFTFAGIALYNAIEILILVLATFRRYRGLYFWSLLVSTVGILPYTLGFVFKYFQVISSSYACITLLVIGWHAMVTGQSVVMFSRLHLITSNQKLLGGILAMIIINWFISNIPTTVLVFGANSSTSQPFAHLYGIWERVQLCLYFAQEVIISLSYVVQVSKMMHLDGSRSSMIGGRDENSLQEKPKWVLKHLIVVNICLIILNVTLVAIEFAGYYEIQMLYKAFLYSCKLKLEFWILNQLTDLSSEMLRRSQESFSEGEQSHTTTAVKAPAYNLTRKHTYSGSIMGSASRSTSSTNMDNLTTAKSSIHRPGGTSLISLGNDIRSMSYASPP